MFLPANFWAIMQTIEYSRAFLLGRMAWARVDGLLLISGAFGLFDKEIAIKAGGYYHKTVGEDMELVLRMRRYMLEKNLPHAVRYVPDPLCWTEVPVSYGVLDRQRNRWTRGTIETLAPHAEMFFNGKYGFIGKVSFQYWTFFVWLAPVIEFSGIMLFILLASFGLINWPFFLLLLALVYSFGFFISCFSLFLEEYSFKKYSLKEMMLLVLGAASEPLIYHPITVYWGIKGNIDFFRGKSAWGHQVRKGFVKK